MPTHFHNHTRALRRRYITVFLGTFVVVFGILSIRFVYANVRYWLVPGTIVRESTLGGAELFPLAKDVEVKPLPSRARLVIDSIGIDAPLVFDVAPDNDTIYKNLERGVVHYSNTPKPGVRGVSVVLGHSSAYPWYKGKYGSVFALLGKLKPGDTFYVQYEDGRLFVFKVKGAIVFNPFVADDRVTELERADGTNIVLISCWPVGTNYRRIAVQAQLISS